ncbi:hypothetical protein, partial [Bacillus velezensis]|uniref:hypothetical protein n=1 Tax=Bacillus velezensis TaxID=492670 RepID=UPI0011A975FC
MEAVIVLFGDDGLWVGVMNMGEEEIGVVIEKGVKGGIRDACCFWCDEQGFIGELYECFSCNFFVFL